MWYSEALREAKIQDFPVFCGCRLWKRMERKIQLIVVVAVLARKTQMAKISGKAERVWRRRL